MATIETLLFSKYAREIVDKIDDISDLSNHDIRRYIEKRLNKEKNSLKQYDQLLRKYVNDALVAKSERLAKQNVENGEAAPLVIEEIDRLLDDLENSDGDLSEDGLRDGYSPDPEPRRIGCPFYFFIESKLRKEWKNRESESLYVFTKKMLQKWQLLSDEEKEKYYKAQKKDKKRFKEEYKVWIARL